MYALWLVHFQRFATRDDIEKVVELYDEKEAFGLACKWTSEGRVTRARRWDKAAAVDAILANQLSPTLVTSSTVTQ